MCKISGPKTAVCKVTDGKMITGVERAATWADIGLLKDLASMFFSHQAISYHIRLRMVIHCETFFLSDIRCSQVS